MPVNVCLLPPGDLQLYLYVINECDVINGLIQSPKGVVWFIVWLRHLDKAFGVVKALSDPLPPDLLTPSVVGGILHNVVVDTPQCELSH